MTDVRSDLRNLEAMLTPLSLCQVPRAVGFSCGRVCRPAGRGTAITGCLRHEWVILGEYLCDVST